MMKLVVLIFIGWIFPGIHAEPAEPEYIVIERDYGGTILLDTETGTRYLRTEDGMSEIDNIVAYDKETRKWFHDHAGQQTTVCKCKICGLFYKPCLGHRCRRQHENYKAG